MNRLEYKEFQGGETIPYDIMADVCVCESLTPRTVAHQAPLSMDFPGKNTEVGNHSLLQGIFPNPGIKPGSPALQAGSLCLYIVAQTHRTNTTKN